MSIPIMSIPITPTQQAAAKPIAVICLLTTIALACASTANAADMPMPTPMKAPEAPLYQWSGCYAGANLGGGAAASNFGASIDPGTYLVPGDPATVSADWSGSRNTDAILAGGQLGCNWQTGTLVVGLEGDFDYFHSNPNLNNNTGSTGISLANGSALTLTQSLTTNYLATIRPRVGIAADRNFAYVTGGAAFTSVSYSESYVDANPAPGPGAGAAATSKAIFGFAAGAGWEYAFADHWTARAEYLFVDFPTATNAAGTIVAPGGTNTFHGTADLVIQVIRAGVNFKF